MIASWTGGQTAILAALVFATIAGVLGDAYTTSVGLAHGYIEANPIEKWAFSKVGQAGATFIGGVATLFVGGTIAAHNLSAGYLYFGLVAGGELIQTALNYKKLRAAKISVK